MQPFFKMSGSGNDFVFFDGRQWEPGGPWETPPRIQEVCARGTGVGADGVVVLAPSSKAEVAIRYFNADGSVASLCGNATLCTIRLAAELGLVADAGSRGLRIETTDRVVSARLAEGQPEFDLGAIEKIDPRVGIPFEGGERRIGYGVAGVPHVVVLVDDVERVDLMSRGRFLRQHPWTGAEGANVNFVAAKSLAPHDGFAIRTYERGVEGETLACGTGSVATAALLTVWGLAPAGHPVRLWTRSGAPLDVRLTSGGSSNHGQSLTGSLRGEGRLVFRGELP